MTKLISFQKSTMQKRPTFEELLNDTVLNPKDKIALPNRQATQLRNTQYLSMWDDPTFLDLDEQAKNITINQIHNNELKTIIQSSTHTTLAEETARRPPPSPPDEPMPPGPPAPPNVPRFSRGTQSTADTAAQTSTFNRPPPPSGGSSRIMNTASSSTQTADQFDMTIDDDMDDRYDDMQRILAAHEEFKRQHRMSIAQQIANHLGPHSSTADQSFVSRLVEERIERERSGRRVGVKHQPNKQYIITTTDPLHHHQELHPFYR